MKPLSFKAFFGAPSGIRTPDTLLKRRKPVQKAQYIVAIKRYNTVFIGVFLAKMLCYTAPYRLGYYQVTITISSPDHNRFLACMGLQVQVLYRALKSPGISRAPGLFIFAKINFVSNAFVVAI